MSEREQFEASMIHSGFDESWLAKDKFFEYEVDDMQRRWEGWQAARAQPAQAVPLHQILTDPENQPNQYGGEFLMHGPKFAFKVGAQQFTLDYEPTEPGEFEYMRDMLVHAFSTFTPDVKPALAGQVPELTSTEVNDACWAFVEALPHQLPGAIFNDLKPAIYAAICKYLERAVLAKRVPMTDEQIQSVYLENMLYQDGLTPSGMVRVTRAIERAQAVIAKGCIVGEKGGA